MNITELTQLLEDLFKSTPITNTVTYYKDSEIDINKVTIYPLINMDHIRYIPQDSVNRFIIQFTILQQRDRKPNLNTDNKRFGDNKVDNWNETSLIANKFLRDLWRHTELTTESTEVVFINKAYTSLLDGVQFTLTIEVDNNTDC